MKIVKVCCKCKMQLGLTEFSKHKLTKDRLRAECKSCSNDCSKSYYETNKPNCAAQQSAYSKANPAKRNAKNAKRRATKLNATPCWLTKEHFKQIEAFYFEAQQLTLSTGVNHQVDHIYPLQGENVCGLHVPSNLQVLTATENISKSNKFTASD